MPRLTEHRILENNLGSELTPDEVEFLLAMERYKREKHRPFPTWHEVLRVVKSLGYRKPEVRDQKSEIRGDETTTSDL